MNPSSPRLSIDRKSTLRLLYDTFDNANARKLFNQHFPVLSKMVSDASLEKSKESRDFVKYVSVKVKNLCKYHATLEDILSTNIDKMLLKMEISPTSKPGKKIAAIVNTFRDTMAKNYPYFNKKNKMDTQYSNSGSSDVKTLDTKETNVEFKKNSLCVLFSSHSPLYRANSFTEGSSDVARINKNKTNLVLRGKFPIGKSNPDIKADMVSINNIEDGKFTKDEANTKLWNKHKRDSSTSTFNPMMARNSIGFMQNVRLDNSDYSPSSSVSIDRDTYLRNSPLLSGKRKTQKSYFNIFNTPITKHGSCESIPIISKQNSSLNLNASIHSNTGKNNMIDNFAIENASEEYMSEVKLLNAAYKKRFPKAVLQLEKDVSNFIQKQVSQNIMSDPNCNFCMTKLKNIACNIITKSKSNTLSHSVFVDATNEIKEIVSNRCDSNVNVQESWNDIVSESNRLLFYFSRTFRLLQCMEFNPVDFVTSVNKAEEEAKFRLSLQGESLSRVPSCIIDKLGLKETSPIMSTKLFKSLSKKLGKDKAEKKVDSPVLSDFENTDVANSSSSNKTFVKYSDFELIKTISNGAYGNVSLVRWSKDNELYAMKRICKSNIKFNNQLQQVFAERDILHKAKHPFVVSLICSFETKTSLCLVMEYVQGGDCRTMLDRIGCFPLNYSRQYAAEIVLALEYIHSLGIVHKDLKPDNLLITRTGHIKLTDFGLSKIGVTFKMTALFELETNPFNDEKILGTPQYIAPEVILGLGYGSCVDWWSLGVIIYEFITGVTPFDAETPRQVFEKIISFNNEIIDKECFDLTNEETNKDRNNWNGLPLDCACVIKGLLTRNPAHRIGCPQDSFDQMRQRTSSVNSVGGMSTFSQNKTNIKNSPFFKNIVWDEASMLFEKAQFIPIFDNAVDTSYFEDRVDRYTHKDLDVNTDDSNVDVLSSSFTCMSEDSSDKNIKTFGDNYQDDGILSTLDKFRTVETQLDTVYTESGRMVVSPFLNRDGKLSISLNKTTPAPVVSRRLTTSQNKVFHTLLWRANSVVQDKSNNTSTIENLKKKLAIAQSDSGNSSKGDETPPQHQLKSKSNLLLTKCQPNRPRSFTVGNNYSRNKTPLMHNIKVIRIHPGMYKQLRLDFGFTTSGVNMPVNSVKIINNNRHERRVILRHVVTSVEINGTAHKAGLRKGYIITHIDKVCIDGISNYEVLNILLQKTQQISLSVITSNRM